MRYPQAKYAGKKWHATYQRRELPQEAVLLRNLSEHWYVLKASGQDKTLVPSPSRSKVK